MTKTSLPADDYIAAPDKLARLERAARRAAEHYGDWYTVTYVNGAELHTLVQGAQYALQHGWDGVHVVDGADADEPEAAR
jgi:hypothetical protein